MQKPGTVTPKPADVTKVRQLVDVHGVGVVAQMFGVPRETLLALVAGVGVRRGTLALFEQRIGAISSAPKPVA